MKQEKAIPAETATCQACPGGAVFLALTILAAIGFRSGLYFANRSLWLDEGMLAWSLVNRSFSELFTPLSYNQAAPVGFLFLTRIAICFLGNHEFALRLIPLLAGFLSVLLFYSISKLYLGNLLEICVPMGFFAVSYPLIHYSAEFKQYSLETAIGLSLLLLAARVETDYSTIRMAVLALCGVVGIWFSYSCCLALAGLGCSLALRHVRDKNWTSLKLLCVVTACWLLSFFCLLQILDIGAVKRSSDGFVFCGLVYPGRPDLRSRPATRLHDAFRGLSRHPWRGAAINRACRLFRGCWDV
jgi:hypothetical protein